MTNKMRFFIEDAQVCCAMIAAGFEKFCLPLKLVSFFIGIHVV